jgi:sugar lactone lactonase YvrE
MNHPNARQRIPTSTFAEGLCRILGFGGGLLVPLLCLGSLAAAGEGAIPDSTWIVVAGQPGTLRQSVKPGESNVWLQDKPPATGLADGNATTAARFKDIGKLAIDETGNLYALDQCDSAVRKMQADGMVVTLARLPDTHDPTQCHAGMAVDRRGDVYVSVPAENVVLRIDPSGSTSVFAGVRGTAGYRNGPAATALFSSPEGLVTDPAGNLYVADSSNNAIRKIGLDGRVTTIAGGHRGLRDGRGQIAKFENPSGLAIDGDGNIYVSEFPDVDDEGGAYTACAIRKISVDGTVATLGENAYGEARKRRVGVSERSIWFDITPYTDMAIDSHGFLYFDTGSGINRINLSRPDSEDTDVVLRTKGINEFAGPGEIVGMVLDRHGNLYVSDHELAAIYKVSPPFGSWGSRLH